MDDIFFSESKKQIIDDDCKWNVMDEDDDLEIKAKVLEGNFEIFTITKKKSLVQDLINQYKKSRDLVKCKDVHVMVFFHGKKLDNHKSIFDYDIDISNDYVFIQRRVAGC